MPKHGSVANPYPLSHKGMCQNLAVLLTLTLSHPLSPSLTLTYPLSHSHSLTLIHSLSLTLTHSHPLSLKSLTLLHPAALQAKTIFDDVRRLPNMPKRLPKRSPKREWNWTHCCWPSLALPLLNYAPLDVLEYTYINHAQNILPGVLQQWVVSKFTSYI